MSETVASTVESQTQNEAKLVPIPMGADRGIGGVEAAKTALGIMVCEAASLAYNINVRSSSALVASRFERPRAERGDLALPCFLFCKELKAKGEDIATKIGQYINANMPSIISRVDVTGAYLNIFLSFPYLCQIIPAILEQNYLDPLPSENKDRVMIEYSQPNTHKAFHVGHMRNVALGDSLVRLYTHIGHQVIAANYFGDEGAHVAKCLWYLKRFYLNSHRLEEAPKEGRGEFLGSLYAAAVDMLELSAHTSMPYPGIVAAKVLSKERHPAPDAPANWHKVVVTVGNDSQFDVVCGGDGYEVGDIVAYAPVGIRFNKKLVEPKDMKGVVSIGVIVAIRELEPEEEEEKAPPAKEEKQAQDKSKKKDDKPKDNKSKDKAPKENAPKKEKVQPVVNNKIMVLPANTPVGIQLIDLGRLESSVCPKDQVLSEWYQQCDHEVKDTLRAMETKEPITTALWEETKQWSLDEFRSIYRWLGSRFDHDFYESEVGDESLHMVQEYYKKGILVETGGAIAADLTKFNLGWCILIKSNGSGLYATKDLALARRKFDNFQIDKSIYVVDAAQTLHFQQVFKVLELMGYEKAKKCFHLAYGLVVLPNGKMSSRKGTVIYFSQLKNMLGKKISEDFLEKYKQEWSQDEIDQALRSISVGIIKYGMLNISPSSDIVFELESWAGVKGNTGPYMMYAYARLANILRSVPVHPDAKVDLSYLNHDSERLILVMLNEIWPTIVKAATTNNPQSLCTYLFDLAQYVSAWYELPDMSIKRCNNIHQQATRLKFIAAIGGVLKTGLSLLGIPVLDRM